MHLTNKVQRRDLIHSQQKTIQNKTGKEQRTKKFGRKENK